MKNSHPSAIPQETLPRSAVSEVETPRPGPLAGGTSVMKSESPSAGLPPLKLQKLKHYELLELIGRGGMGDVYRARDQQTNRIVAVKALSTELTRDEQFVKRFEREARALAKLEHPHIVPVYDIDRDQGHVFYVMQYVAGESLDRRMRRAGRPTRSAALRIISQCLQALAAAHLHQLVHRDVKPGNVLLQEGNDHVYLVDFGLVRRFDSNTSFTETGVVMGTVDYMSPEQARGSANIDHRADLYAIGVMLYHLLSGHLPLAAPSFQGMLYSHAYETPQPITEVVSNLPAPLAELVTQLLAKSPADRPASCHEVLKVLEPLLQLEIRAQQLEAECQVAANAIRAQGQTQRIEPSTQPQVAAELAAVEQQVHYLQNLKTEGEQLCVELAQIASEVRDEQRDNLAAASYCGQANSIKQRLDQVNAELNCLVALRTRLAALSSQTVAQRTAGRRTMTAISVFAVSALLIVLLGVTAAISSSSWWVDRQAVEPATKPGPSRPPSDDFTMQGEYAGSIDSSNGKTRFGVQVISLGVGRFHAVGYRGGLPGDGWDHSTTLEADGESKDGAVTFNGSELIHTLKDGVLTLVDANRQAIGHLKKVTRQSPTLGAKPPPGAIVLFDGTSANAWERAKIEDGQLLPGATSKQTFGSHKLHLEFQTPYAPKEHGQSRGNSGLYLQGRYEVQILDSFGLKAGPNECGAIFSLRSPNEMMCLPPLAWQTFDIDYRAGHYDTSGKVVQNPRVTVTHNGVVIHKDVELPGRGVTTAAPNPAGVGPGPIYLQDRGNPVRFRNIWVEVDSADYLARANIHLRQAKLDMARSDYEHLIRQSPDQHYWRGMLAAVCLALGDDAEYRRHCQYFLTHLDEVKEPHERLHLLRIVFLTPDAAQGWSAEEQQRIFAAERDSEWKDRVAILWHYRHGRWQQAIEIGERYLTMHQAWRERAQCMVLRAMALQQAGDEKRATDQLLAVESYVIQHVPESAKWTEAANLLFLQIFYREATELIRRSREELKLALPTVAASSTNESTRGASSPPQPPTYLEGPLELLSAAVEQSPRNPDAWIRRSRWHVVRHNWKEARADCEQYLQLKPDNMWVRREYLDICLALEDKDPSSYYAVANYVSSLPAGRYAFDDLRSLCLVPPKPAVDVSALTQWAARSGRPKTISPSVYLTAVHYRAGDYQTCVAVASEAFPEGPQYLLQSLPCLFEAAALKKLGKDTEARDKLIRVRDFLEQGKTLPYQNSREKLILNYTFDTLHSQIFYREASELILGQREELKAPLAIDLIKKQSAK